MVKKRSWFFATTMMAGYIAITGMIWMGGRALISGEMTAGDLTSFFLYTFMVAGGFAELAGLWGSLKRAAGAAQRLFEIVDTSPEVASPAKPTPLPEGGGHLAFEGVTFRYPARADVEVLRDVSFEVKPGQVIAIVGASGGGKSTILQLLFRFFDANAGRVTFEGVDVRQLALPELRRALALVAQDPVLFSGTIAENICYGLEGGNKGSGDAGAMERAARDANAHEFIAGFPDGYETVVGERGVKLSGGQKQRLALARALVTNPRVLVLDEATSNLDAESEAVVQAAISRVMRGRTTVIVAHRLSTIRDADVILVLEHGQLVEQGTHGALMEKGGVYQRLVERQTAI
ncbi:MAG: ATP-binding cassette domain-containing protein [Myxococcales bacterium]|nr:ATP-binding cassette domain-containing protein [Myxococcales bacterium]